MYPGSLLTKNPSARFKYIEAFGDEDLLSESLALSLSCPRAQFAEGMRIKDAMGVIPVVAFDGSVPVFIQGKIIG